MLQETPQDGLNRYEIGAKLRALRLRRKMGLVELGKHTGLSSAMLSKVERGRLFPTLSTLFRIASVFGVGLNHFFGDPPRSAAASIVRQKDRSGPGTHPAGRLAIHHVEALEFAVADPQLNLFYAEFEPRLVSPSDRHSHKGIEVVFVITGRVRISFDDVDHLVEPGDAIYFDAERPHGYGRDGHERCTALMVATAPRD